MTEEKKKDGRGGRRKGAGRKPNYLKKMGASPLTAAHLLAHVDELKLWEHLLHDKSSDVRMRALSYLTDRRDGRAKQSMDVSGGMNLNFLAERIETARKRRLADETKDRVIDAHMSGRVFTAVQRSLPPAPESKESTPAPAQVVASAKPWEVNVPIHCDKHGPFSPETKWESGCPRCTAEREQQIKAEKRLRTLIPGEPMWSRR
jgi:hypothetical protein